MTSRGRAKRFTSAFAVLGTAAVTLAALVAVGGFKPAGGSQIAPVALPANVTAHATCAGPSLSVSNQTATSLDLACATNAPPPTTTTAASTTTTTVPVVASPVVDQLVKGFGTAPVTVNVSNASAETLVALVAADDPSSKSLQAATVSGGGLAWRLVGRTDARQGDAEIWTAQSTGANVAVTASLLNAGVQVQLTVVSFAHSSGVGATGSANAASGAAAVALTPTATGSLGYAVGFDWDNAIARVALAGQSVDQQTLTSAGDTAWVEHVNAPLSAGSAVTIGTSSPTGDRYNIQAVEITPGPAAPPPTTTTTAPTTTTTAPTTTTTGASTTTTAAAGGNGPAGQVSGWGADEYGDLGDRAFGPGRSNVAAPADASGLFDAVSVSPGIAARADGTVWTWGFGGDGELGMAAPQNCAFSGGSNPCSTTPVQVPGLSGVVQVASGQQSRFAVTATGAVWAWGVDNQSHDLGDGVCNSQYNSTPRPVLSVTDGTPLTGITQLDTYGTEVIARKADGTVWVWGADFAGQLGNGTSGGTNNDSPCAATPATIDHVVSVATDSGINTALKDDGSVWQWGGPIGYSTGTTCTEPLPPLRTPNCLTLPTKVADHAIAVGPNSYVAADGSVWTWTNSSTRVQVPGLSRVTALRNGLALESDGSVWNWTAAGASQQPGIAAASAIGEPSFYVGPGSLTFAVITAAAPPIALAAGDTVHVTCAGQSLLVVTPVPTSLDLNCSNSPTGPPPTTTTAASTTTTTVPVVVSPVVDQLVKGFGTAPVTVNVSNASSETLVALVAADDPSSKSLQAATVSGGGLAWRLVGRTDARQGDAEIWTAQSAGANVAVTASLLNAGVQVQLTVVSFAHSSGVGATGSANAASGAAAVALTPTATGSLGYAVGFDWDNAIARVALAGQSIDQQTLTSAGDTAWVEHVNAPLSAGSAVTIGTSSPTGDRYNIQAVEITP